MFPQKKLYKNTFYTGLKATHFIEEMSTGISKVCLLLLNPILRCIVTSAIHNLPFFQKLQIEGLATSAANKPLYINTNTHAS